MKFAFNTFFKSFFLFLILSLVSILVFYYLNNQKVKQQSNLVYHTQEVLRKSDAVLIDVIAIETGVRGYVLTGNEDFLKPFNQSIKTISKNLFDLEALTKNKIMQKMLVDSMMGTSVVRAILISKIITLKKNNSLNDSDKTKFINESLLMTALISSRIARFNEAELNLLKLRNADYQTAKNTSENAYLAIVLLIGSIFMFIAFLIQKQKIKTETTEALEAQMQERNNQLDAANDLLHHKSMEVIDSKSKLMSEYARSLIEASLDPFITVSSEGKITDLNEAFALITGKTHEALAGTNFFDYFTDPKKAKEIYEEVFEKGFVKNYPLTIKDHVLTDVLFNGSVYKNEHDQVIGAVVVARDITDLKKIEKELYEAKTFAEEAKSKAENAVKSKQQFLANMSHEIRTPMNSIIGFTRVLLKTDLTIKQQEFINAIKLSGDTLIVLINDILDLAKVDAGKMVFEKTPFKLKSSASAILHLFETKIQEKNLRLIKEYDSKIPAILLGDSIRLHQILLNLISNAVKFTKTGTITLSVNLLKENDQNVCIEFAVIDTGIGINQEIIDTIFENFQQATSETTRLYGGTGLGLAIVKNLVEAQGGVITVKSELGKGSTFSFILNFQKASPDTEITAEITELDNHIKNINVLVVEDMALNQLLIQTLLDDFGFDYDIVSNGKIAISKLEKNNYDIILMDLQMPEMNGFEATEYIRKTMKSNIPIIALTADVTTIDVDKCKEVGMDDFISKPIDENQLHSKMVNAFRKIALTKSIEEEMAQIEKIRFTDLSYLNHRTKSNPTLMMEMITVYLEQTPSLIKTMKQSLIDKDWVLLNAAVHKMLPSFAIVGMSSDFENVAKKIQEYANTLEMTDKIHDLVIHLESACTQACKELEEEFQKINKPK